MPKPRELSNKQRAFADNVLAGMNGTNAAKQAGYEANSDKAFGVIATNNLVKVSIKAYIERKRRKVQDKIDEELIYTRKKQLDKLDKAYDRADKQDSPTAMVSAIREQNEMLGYHRELGPNKERESERKAKIDKELEALRALARQRTGQLSRSIPIRKETA